MNLPSQVLTRVHEICVLSRFFVLSEVEIHTDTEFLTAFPPRVGRSEIPTCSVHPVSDATCRVREYVMPNEEWRW